MYITYQIVNEPEISFKESFKEWVLRCAASSEIRTEVSEETEAYRKSCLDRAYKRSRELETMSIEEADAKAELAYQAQIKVKSEDKIRKMKDDKSLFDMREKLESWKPPTVEHEAFKSYLLQELDYTITLDYEHDFPVLKLTGKEWLEFERTDVKYDIAYHSDRRREEQEALRKANEWMSALRESLPEK